MKSMLIFHKEGNRHIDYSVMSNNGKNVLLAEEWM
jgi:hypothetical protein